MDTVAKRLKALNITLPEAAAPVANYVPFVVLGPDVYLSGQLPKGPDGLTTGRLGDDVSVTDGQAAARLCGINLIAQMQAACDGDLERVRRVVKLGGFVNATADFIEIPQVINGCSDLMVEVFGEAGRHARSAIGCPTLPLGVAVEIDCIFEIKG